MVLTVIEFVLGALYGGRVSVGELYRMAARYQASSPAPFTLEDVARALRELESVGVLTRRGVWLELRRDRLHPLLGRIAVAASRELLDV